MDFVNDLLTFYKKFVNILLTFYKNFIRNLLTKYKNFINILLTISIIPLLFYIEQMLIN